MTTKTNSTKADEAAGSQASEKFIITEFKSGGIETVKVFLEENFSKYSAEVAAEVPQIDSKEGRARVKALAAEINKRLSEDDTPMRDYLRDIKKQPKLIEAIAKANKEKYTKLRADILKPLEEAQAGQDADLATLTEVPTICGQHDITSDRLNEIIEWVESFDFSEVWPELKKKFKTAHEAALTTARVTLERVEEKEAQEAELEELRRKQAKAEQDERDRKIREEAEAKAKKESEAKAQKEREDIERRAVESKQREEQAEADKQKAIRDAELAEERREQEAINNKAREEQAKIDAEAESKRKSEQAAKNERQRIAEEEAQAEQDAKDRENDKKHRTAINRAALVDLIAGGVDEDQAKKAITAIARKSVRNISIQY